MLPIPSLLASGDCQYTCHKTDKTHRGLRPEKGLRGGRPQQGRREVGGSSVLMEADGSLT